MARQRSISLPKKGLLSFSPRYGLLHGKGSLLFSLFSLFLSLGGGRPEASSSTASTVFDSKPLSIFHYGVQEKAAKLQEISSLAEQVKEQEVAVAALRKGI